MRLAEIKQLDINRQWAIYWYLRGRRSPVALFSLPILAALCLLAALSIWGKTPALSSLFGALLSLQPPALQALPTTPLIVLIALVALAFYFANSAELTWRKELDARRTLKERTGLRPESLDPAELENFQPDSLENLGTPPGHAASRRQPIAGSR